MAIQQAIVFSFFLIVFLLLSLFALGSSRRLYQHAAWHRGFGHYLIQETARINFNLAGSLLGQLLWLPVQGFDLDYNAQSMGLGNCTPSTQEIKTWSFSIYTYAFSCSHLTHFSFPLSNSKSLLSQACLSNSPVISDSAITHISVCTCCTIMDIDYNLVCMVVWDLSRVDIKSHYGCINSNNREHLESSHYLSV